MKRAIGAVLAAVILMVSCLSGCGGGGEKWDPSSLPHNSNLKLSDSKDQFLAADQVELIYGDEDKEDQSYTSADGYKVKLGGQEFTWSYDFKGDQLDCVIYSSEYGISESEKEPILNALKKTFESVYGEAQEYTGPSTFLTGYTWKFKDDAGTPFQAAVVYSDGNGDAEWACVQAIIMHDSGE